MSSEWDVCYAYAHRYTHVLLTDLSMHATRAVVHAYACTTPTSTHTYYIHTIIHTYILYINIYIYINIHTYIHIIYIYIYILYIHTYYIYAHI